MVSFAIFQQQWDTYCTENPTLASLLTDSVLSLLQHEGQEFVRQGMSLLMALDPSALVYVLEGRGEKLYLSSSLENLNKQYVQESILLEIKESDSAWFPLLQQGCFDNMMLSYLESIEYSKVHSHFQEGVLRESQTMIKVPPGEFMMGDPYGLSYQKPFHQVRLTRSLLVGAFQVTQALYEHVMGKNSSDFTGCTRPVDSVEWEDCIQFCNALSDLEGIPRAYTQIDGSWHCDFDSPGYRLPTEAEWEYCARANQNFMYAGSNDCDEVAWYGWNALGPKNSNGHTHAVGKLKANGFGLYDMSGNVAEWCWDQWYESYEHHHPRLSEDYFRKDLSETQKDILSKHWHMYERMQDNHTHYFPFSKNWEGWNQFNLKALEVLSQLQQGTEYSPIFPKELLEDSWWKTEVDEELHLHFPQGALADDVDIILHKNFPIPILKDCISIDPGSSPHLQELYHPCYITRGRSWYTGSPTVTTRNGFQNTCNYVGFRVVRTDVDSRP